MQTHKQLYFSFYSTSSEQVVTPSGGTDASTQSTAEPVEEIPLQSVDAERDKLYKEKLRGDITKNAVATVFFQRATALLSPLEAFLGSLHGSGNGAGDAPQS